MQQLKNIFPTLVFLAGWGVLLYGWLNPDRIILSIQTFLVCWSFVVLWLGLRYSIGLPQLIKIGVRITAIASFLLSIWVFFEPVVLYDYGRLLVLLHLLACLGGILSLFDYQNHPRKQTFQAVGILSFALFTLYYGNWFATSIIFWLAIAGGTITLLFALISTWKQQPNK